MNYTKQECLEVALKYKTEGNFIKNFREISEYSKEQGWYDEITMHMISSGTKRTKEECSNIAKQYNTRSEFKRNDYNVYCYSLKKEWLEDICSHMKRLKNKKTEEECRIEALKYSRRIDFAKESPSYYYYSLGSTWFESICSHMKYDYPEMNTIYMWKVYNTNIWKFGICNRKRLKSRINEVAFSKNYIVEKMLFKVTDNCRELEKQLLNLGIKHTNSQKSEFGGDTEFRELNSDELKIALNYFMED